MANQQLLPPALGPPPQNWQPIVHPPPQVAPPPPAVLNWQPIALPPPQLAPPRPPPAPLPPPPAVPPPPLPAPPALIPVAPQAVQHAFAPTPSGPSTAYGYDDVKNGRSGLFRHHRYTPHTGTLTPQETGLTPVQGAPPEWQAHPRLLLQMTSNFAPHMRSLGSRQICPQCQAHVWEKEASAENDYTQVNKWGICCQHGQVSLASFSPRVPSITTRLRVVPKEFRQGQPSLPVHRDCAHFLTNIRSYNNAFVFAFQGVEVRRLPVGVQSFKIGGSLCHRMGSLIPHPNTPPVFAQMWTLDPDQQTTSRLSNRPDLRHTILQQIQADIQAVSPFVAAFRQAADPNTPQYGVMLSVTDGLDRRRYNLPRSSERARCLIHDLTVKNGLGKAGSRNAAKGWLWVIEWQKRGLPHLHLLLWLHDRDIPRKAHDFNELICAEIPDPETEKAVHDLVVNHMIHGPCGDLAACAATSYKPPCFDEKKGACDKHFPKPFSLQTVDTEDGYPLYRHRPPNPSSGLQEDTGHTAEVRGVRMDNRWVVPYNKPLLLKYNCHLNVEFCRSVKCVKYLNKYVYKGPDRAMAKVVSEDAQGNIDKIQNFVDGRYISSGKAVWHLLDFPLNGCSHNVERLACHLENHQSVSFDPVAELSVNNIIQAGPPKTTLTAFFEYNSTPSVRLHPGESPHTLLYHEFSRYYTFNNSTKTWKLRDRVKKALDRGEVWANAGVDKVVGRVHWASPSQGERFFLRLCLIHQKGATSVSDLKTVGGVTYGTYREAGVALGVVMDDNEWRDALTDADLWATPPQLRDLFCVILAYNAPADPPRL
uniref:Helitron helicase-like domain-containing protein n=1 Tax=Chromera velia CCMP2878 TaxID=1169474 RepID=A0A0G4F472_9ALVE|eukprot:Cvel_15115.t1-p1 / transcript=Cvel_15115.t1 / gene=Cvel_15115 / organism=Chromera_velia_CCMP2878 / gene_product=hypothetical protein / transcript_product=hypothetical protein / location=Cvel_scaffold1103:13399-16821(+) / protein_length=816 / sequence_SO=supercontig / SO=protein_coding / is_pseudo=false